MGPPSSLRVHYVKWGQGSAVQNQPYIPTWCRLTLNSSVLQERSLSLFVFVTGTVLGPLLEFGMGLVREEGKRCYLKMLLPADSAWKYMHTSAHSTL